MILAEISLRGTKKARQKIIKDEDLKNYKLIDSWLDGRFAIFQDSKGNQYIGYFKEASPGSVTTTAGPGSPLAFDEHDIELRERPFVSHYPGSRTPSSGPAGSSFNLHKDAESEASGQGKSTGVPDPATKLTPAARAKLGNLTNRAGEKVADVIRSRGGSGSNVNQAGQWAQKTLGETAKAAVDGDKTAESAIKIVKQAGRLGQKY